MCAKISGSPRSRWTSRSGRETCARIIDWIGWDRILFATDYPHWDFDDPRDAFKIRLSDDERRMVFAENARHLYRLP